MPPCRRVQPAATARGSRSGPVLARCQAYGHGPRPPPGAASVLASRPCRPRRSRALARGRLSGLPPQPQAARARGRLWPRRRCCRPDRGRAQGRAQSTSPAAAVVLRSAGNARARLAAPAQQAASRSHARAQALSRKVTVAWGASPGHASVRAPQAPPLLLPS
jgi:hypothetical protein